MSESLSIEEAKGSIAYLGAAAGAAGDLELFSNPDLGQLMVITEIDVVDQDALAGDVFSFDVGTTTRFAFWKVVVTDTHVLSYQWTGTVCVPFNWSCKCALSGGPFDVTVTGYIIPDNVAPGVP